MGTTHSAAGADSARAASEAEPALHQVLRELEGGIRQSDRHYYLRTYRNVLVGSEVVDWIVSRPYCSGRDHAVQIGQKLVDAGFLHHVTHDHPFKDEDLFYRLRPLAPGSVDAQLNAAERRAVEYDLVVIGGGAAGLTAASFAGKLGARVALIEKARLGGDCTWSGCVPSKTLLAIAKQAHTLRKSQAAAAAVAEAAGPEDPHGPYVPLHNGVSLVGDITVDMRQVRAKIQSVIQRIYAEEDPAAISRKGVDVIIANVILATGASPRAPDLPGISTVPHFTYESIWANERLPRRLVVVGAGPIGCELAQAYSYLGADVTLIGSRLLAKEEEASRQVMARVFEREGLRFVAGRPSAVRRGADHTDETPDIRVKVGEDEVQCDMLLLAVGRTAHTGSLALGNAGISVGAHGGVVVDDRLQTSLARVFAAGDCIDGNEQFTHLAGKQGFVAARNAMFWGTSSGTVSALPRCTFTSPEVAAVGLTAEQATAKHGDAVKTYKKALSTVDRSLAEDDVDGYVSISVFKESGKLAGVTAVGSRAGEIVSQGAVAMTNGLKVKDIALTVLPYPAHMFALQQVCSMAASELFQGSTVGTIINGFYRKARKNRLVDPSE